MLKLILQIFWLIFGIGGAIFAVYKNKLCWVFYLLANICGISVLIMLDTYIPIPQYLVFMGINIAGWMKWKKD